jgi:hypothetical protein
MKGLARFLLAAGAVAIAWVPLGVIITLGALTCWNIVSFLLSPGIPLVFAYQTETGKATVRIGSYDIDPEALRVSLNNLELKDPDGKSVVKLNRARVRLEKGVPLVELDHLESNLRRGKDGALMLGSFLPPPSDKQDPFAIRLLVNKASLVLVDDQLEETYLIDLNDLEVDHADGSTLVLAQASIQKDKFLPLNLHVSSKGDAVIRTQLNDQELAPLVPLLESWLPPEAKYGWGGLRARSIKARGPLYVELNPREMAKIEGNFEVSTLNLSVPNLIKDVSAAGQMRVAEDKASFELTASRPGSQFGFKGVADFGGKVEGEGLLTAAGKSSLWPEVAKLLPPGYNFSRGTWKGRLSFGKTFGVEGALTAASADVEGWKVLEPKVELGFDGTSLAAELKSAQVEGRDLSGWVSWNSKTKVIAGKIDSPEASFGKILSRFKLKDIDLEGPISVILSGTDSKPVATLETRVQGYLPLGDDQEPLRVTRLDLRGKADTKGFVIHRASGLTPAGLAGATGSITWKGGLDLLAQATGVRLGTFAEGVRGTVFASAKVKGTFDQPLVEGEAEAYSVEVQGRKIPYARTKFVKVGSEWQAQDLVAQAGTGTVQGNLAWNQKTDGIEGSLTGRSLLATDILPDLVGSLDLESAMIGGTLAKPQVSAKVTAETLLAYGIPLSNLQAAMLWSGPSVTLQEISAQARTGSVSGSGGLNLDTKVLAGTFKVDQVPLGLAPISAEIASLGGSITGEGVISGDFDLPKMDFTGQVKDAEVNATNFGSGTVRAGLLGPKLTLSGELGSLDRFIILNPSEVDFEKETLMVDADLLNLTIPDLVKASQERWKSLEAYPQQIVRSLEGQISGKIGASGTFKEPQVTLSEGQASGLKILARSAGDIVLAGGYKGGIWNLEKGVWDTKSGVLRLNEAAYSEKDGLKLTGEVTEFDLSWINLFQPSAPLLSGTASLAAQVSGPLDGLSGQASLLVSDVAVIGEKGPTKVLESLDLGDIILDRGLVEAKGRARWQGLLAKIDAFVPFSAFDPEAEDQRRVRVSARLDPRPLSEFIEYAPGLKGATLDGVVEGSAELGGTAGDWTMALDIQGKANAIRLPQSSTWFKDLTFRLTGDSTQAQFTANTAGSRDGSLEANLKAAYPDLLSAETAYDQLLDLLKLDGVITAKSFRVEDPLPNATSASGATISGQVAVKGTGSSPRISGEIRARGTTVNMPAAFPEGKAADPLANEPIFEGLTLRLEDEANINFGLGQVGVTGQGVLQGPLSAMNLRMPLEVKRGVLRLPNARITLEEGTVNVSMRGDTGAVVRVDVDMTGETHVVARRGPDTYEDYAVTLTFRGDLLDPKGLSIDAQADPGDLSRDEILAILGQKQLIEALAGTALQGQGSLGLRDPLYQLLAPTISDPITGPLGRLLKLDYLSLDYNPLDQALSRFGKSLGSGFFVQGWYQLSEPRLGPRKYDLRLSYRLPRIAGINDRLRLSLGTTQDRPWRISIDWGRRF